MPTAPMDLTTMLTSGEAARALEVSQNSVNVLRRAGTLPGVETRLGWLYPRASVEQLRRERARRAGQREVATA